MEESPLRAQLKFKAALRSEKNKRPPKKTRYSLLKKDAIGPQGTGSLEKQRVGSLVIQ